MLLDARGSWPDGAYYWLAKVLGSNPAPSLYASLPCWHEAPRNTEQSFDSNARTYASLSS